MSGNLRIGFPFFPPSYHTLSYFWPMTHHSNIGWVQVGGAWALCVLHFCVCSKLVCCSCVCHGLEVRLRVLLFILSPLWCELISDPLFFMACFLQGLGISWLWAFLPFSLLFAPSVGLPVFLPCHSVISIATLFDPYSLGLFRAYGIFFFQLVTMTQYGHWVYSHATLGFLDSLYCLWAPLANFVLLGHPRPVCFPWASSAHFLTLYSHGILLTLLGFPIPITTSFILGAYGPSINPLLSYFEHIMAHSYFSTSHNAHSFATSFFGLF